MKLPFQIPQLNRNFLSLGLAVGAGLVALLLSLKYLNDQRNQIEAEAAGHHKMVTVVVAKEDMPRGAVVQPAAFATNQVPVEYVPSSAIDPKHFRLAVGQKLAVPLRHGEPLLVMHLESTAQVFSASLQNGNRAITTEVDEVNSISGLLRPSDHIDLMVTAHGTKANAREITFPLMTNVEVLATGQVTRKAEGNAGRRTYTTITLSVSPTDAERIVVAKSSGKLTAVLRNPQDAEASAIKAMNIDDVLPNKKPVGERFAVQYIIGGH